MVPSVRYYFYLVVQKISDTDDPPRVTTVQAQARAALRLAVGFALAAAGAAVLPHDTGAWLPLHLFLVGALGLAVSGVTRLFAVTWSAGSPSPSTLVATQRWLLAAGVGGLAVGRELDAPVVVLAGFGLCVSGALALLGALLLADVRHARVRRFDAALRYYLTAITAGLVGTALGAAMVSGGTGLRDAHVILNLLGFLGLVIAGTLPTFAATQVRMKVSPRATPRRLGGNLVWLAGALVVAASAELAGAPRVAAGGLLAYAAGLLHLLTALPRPGRKQFAWAGPRLVLLAAGLAWWIVIVVVAAVRVLAGQPAFPEPLVVTLVVAGYAQILLGSLAYLAPVLRGGGHRHLSAGFATTRSWVAVAAANLGGLAWLAGWPALTVVATAVLAADLAQRSIRLARTPSVPDLPKETVDV